MSRAAWAATGLALLLPLPATAQSGSIQGRVWSDDGVPVLSAVVTVVPTTGVSQARYATSDDLGYFTVAGLTSGSYTLRVSAL
ncbi:MAG: carboxypeptidase-like regulatory domain-containing protein, partial [Gemmatimonadota bacterium]|nr:carboxypeptidase-like regulatory domain-containing protein [Gemmatimonadota bacterium]